MFQPQNDIEKLISVFAKLPGLGPRSARRLVLTLLRRKEQTLMPLIAVMQHAAENAKTCATCGNIDMHDPCSVCVDPKRDPSVICVVEEVADLWAMERSPVYKGMYHVLGGTLSAMEDRGPSKLNIESLITRAAADAVKEVILATNATVEGQTTAHYVSERLESCNVKQSRLAQGIPVGGELDYLDEGTLMAALNARKVV